MAATTSDTNGRFGAVTLAAPLIGALWGGLWMIVVGVLLMLVTGIIIVPQIGWATLVGAALGGAFLWRAPDGRNNAFVVSLAAIAGGIFFVLTGFQPFGTSMGGSLFSQLVALVVWLGLLALSVRLCLTGYEAGSTSRYRLEVLFVRVL